MASNMLIFLLLMLVSFNSVALNKLPINTALLDALKLAVSNSDRLEIKKNSETQVPRLNPEKVPSPRFNSEAYKVSNPTLNSVAYNFPSNYWTSPNIWNHLETPSPSTILGPWNAAISATNARRAWAQQRTEPNPPKIMPSNLETLDNLKSGEQISPKSIRKKALLKLFIFYDNALKNAKRFNSIAKKAWFKQRTKSVPSRTMPSNPEILEKLKSSETTPSKYPKTSDSEYALKNSRKESLKQQRMKSEGALEFEKQVDEYEKIQNKIEELNEQIGFLEGLIAKNGKMEAIYEKIIKDYMDRKRNQLFCVMEKEHWHEARLAKLDSCKSKKVAECCLNTQKMKADKFCPEVMEAYNERKLVRLLEIWHEINFFIGDQFAQK